MIKSGLCGAVMYIVLVVLAVSAVNDSPVLQGAFHALGFLVLAMLAYCLLWAALGRWAASLLVAVACIASGKWLTSALGEYLVPASEYTGINEGAILFFGVAVLAGLLDWLMSFRKGSIDQRVASKREELGYGRQDHQGA